MSRDPTAVPYLQAGVARNERDIEEEAKFLLLVEAWKRKQPNRRKSITRRDKAVKSSTAIAKPALTAPSLGIIA
jgi:hypothetical protein